MGVRLAVEAIVGTMEMEETTSTPGLAKTYKMITTVEDENIDSANTTIEGTLL